MNKLIAAAVIGAASTCAAQVPEKQKYTDEMHKAYQEALLKRTLSADDKALCDEKAGKKKVEQVKCHVTREFVSDIRKSLAEGKRVFWGFPRSADYKYLRDKAEKDLLIDVMMVLAQEQ